MDGSTQEPESRGVRKQPIQQRSQASLDRLLDATEEILREKPFSEILVADIVKRAKSSVGVFYSRFRDKADILIALRDREDMQSVVLSENFLDVTRVATTPPSVMVEESLRALVDHYRRRQHVIAPIVGLSLSNPERYHDSSISATIDAMVGRLPDEFLSVIGHASPRVAVRTAIGMVIAFLEHLAVMGDRPFGGLTLNDPRLIEELVRMILNYLEIRPRDAQNG